MSIIVVNNNSILGNKNTYNQSNGVPLIVGPFVAIFDTRITGVTGLVITGVTNYNQIQLPFISGGTYNCIVDWGDSSSSVITTWDQPETLHTYSTPGVYTVTISASTGNLTGWQYNNGGDKIKLIEITSWGPLRTGNVEGSFRGCYYLKLTGVTDKLDLSNTDNLNYTFSDCVSLTTIKNINYWRTSNLTGLTSTFAGYTEITGTTPPLTGIRDYIINFDDNIGNWDVSNVTDMSSMFSRCWKFNNGAGTGQTLTNYTSISGWNVSNVTNMDGMFYGCLYFNRPIGNWDVSNVTDMGGMFGCDNGLTSKIYSYVDLDLSNWHVGSLQVATNMFFRANRFNNLGNSRLFIDGSTSAITSAYGMFNTCTLFNQPLSGWNVSSVTDMSFMFYQTLNFNQDIGYWNTNNVTDMSFMFQSTYFNNGNSPSISGWNVSNVTGMTAMFYNTPSFNQPIGNWERTTPDVSTLGNVGSTNSMFVLANVFNQDIGNWNMQSNQNMGYMFATNSSFNNGNSPSISGWNVSSVTTMLFMFRNATKFNQPIGNWNVGNVKSMQQMFYGGAGTMIFNQDIGNWNVSGVTDMSLMFYGLTPFRNGNSPSISGWNVSSVITTERMFNLTSNFNQPISNWDLRNNQSTYLMFGSCPNFNQSLSNWRTDSLINAANMFLNCTTFNSSLSGWNVSNLQSTSLMFGNCPAFNQPLSNWERSTPGDTSTLANLVNASSMFSQCYQFNQDIGNWNVSGLTYANSMFISTPFNNGGSPSIANWKTKSLQYTTSMFSGNRYFNQPISGWVTSNLIDSSSMFKTSYAFNQPLSNWERSTPGDTSTLANLVNASSMFYQCTGFNQNIGNWDTSSIVTTNSMFFQDYAFNNGGSPLINSWNTSKVNNMNSMFQQTSLNQPISGWNVSSVTGMSAMLASATAFNQPLSNWERSTPGDTSTLSNVTDMSSMFSTSTAFDQDIGNWNVSGVTNFTGFMTVKTNLNYSATNLDSIYNNWSLLPLKTGLTITFNLVKSTANGLNGKRRMLSGFSWTISDGGL